MQISNIPAKFQIPWANAASSSYKRAIPVAPQSGANASFTDGFPAPTFSPLGSGGQRPFGQDFNGILNVVTEWLRWVQAGYTPIYDATFSTQIGGYPKDVILRSADGHAFWRSTVDNNTSNPDTGGANWVAFGVHTVFGRPGPDIVATSGDYTAAMVGALDDTAFDDCLLAVNGYQAYPSGLLEQWGETSSIAEDTEVAITFPVPFPVQCFNIQVTGDYGGHTDSDVIGQFNRSSLTRFGCTLMRDSGGGGGYNGVLHWNAKGK